ncbi:type II toxin-antitoxin system RelE/ParE family toxin [Candidatus Peregrinibacteria bacterium]|nr:type II toxin-antitoxin system RelE/ParE family toxin [Candidatus Peregrinibacteria bacterium]
MQYKIFLTDTARRDLKYLQEDAAKRVIQKLFFYSEQENPLSFAKSLQGDFHGRYRFRIGQYRAIFRIEKDGQISILFILRVKHRKDVYDL